MRWAAALLAALATAAASRATHVLVRNDTRPPARRCERDGATYRCDPIAIFVGRGHTGSANLAASAAAWYSGRRVCIREDRTTISVFGDDVATRRFLSSHPDVTYGQTKEHRFFTRSRRPLDVGRYRREFPASPSPASPPFGVDLTPEYGDRPGFKRVAGVIRDAVPDARILIAVRRQPDLIMSKLYGRCINQSGERHRRGRGMWIFRGDESRHRRGRGTWTFRGDESRHRRGRDVDVPRRPVAAPPRLRRGYSVETNRGAADIP